MSNAIEIRGLTKCFGELTAVNELTLDIEEGTLVSLLGVNGAGKTTTIKMLSGLIAPTRGDAILMGNSIANNPHEVKKHINVSPQETAVARNLSVYENLLMIAGIYGFNTSEAKERADKMLEDFGLDSVKNKKAKTLSGGWQRRLSIALALISEPKILFLDEPTLGLDVLAHRELWAQINKLKGKMTIILTTHYMEEAEELSDSIAIMTGGTLKARGTAAELIERTGAKNFEDAFVKLATAEGETK